MAGDWIKYQKTTGEKPEVFEIAGQLEIDPDAVIGKLLRVWSWFDDHSVDGNASVTVIPLLDRLAGVTGFVTALINVGWMKMEEESLTIPNFGRHNGKTAKNRALTNERVAKSRTKSNAKCNGPSVTKSVTREEKRREDNSISMHAGFPEKQTVLDYCESQGWDIKEGLAFWLHFDQAKSNGDRAIGPNWHWWSRLEQWVMESERRNQRSNAKTRRNESNSNRGTANEGKASEYAL